jgi:ABC-type metal ion transport system substrate-binding protein
MSDWTVLLARPDYIADDNLDTYMTHVEAPTPAKAIRKAQGEAIVCDYASDESTRFAELREFAEYHDRDDYAVLLVIRGKHEDVKP